MSDGARDARVRAGTPAPVLASDHTDRPAAIVAAADGELILVRAGDHTHVELAGKGLCIFPEQGTPSCARCGRSAGPFRRRHRHDS